MLSKDKKWDLLTALGSIVGGVLIIYFAQPPFILESSTGGGEYAKASAFPKLVAQLMIALSCLQIASVFFTKEKTDISEKAKNADVGETSNTDTIWAIDKKFLLIAGTGATLILYTFLLDYVGYLLSTPIMLILLFLILGIRSWLTILLISGIATASIYYFFEHLMFIVLPIGTLSGF